MVSVIIPNYNHAPYLRKRIDSVLCQTYQNFELIILDDNSTDKSRDIIEEYATHPKVSHIVYNKINSGSTFIQWNKGISLAKGEYIWIAESDDYADATFLEKLVRGIETTPNCVLAYSELYKMDADETNFRDWQYTYPDRLDTNLLKSDFVCEGVTYIKKFLTVENTIPNASAVIFSKKAFYKVGTTDEDIKFCSDWLLWLKILTQGDIIHLNENLNYFRTHSTSVIGRIWKETNSVFLKKYTIIMWHRFLLFIKSNSNIELALKKAVENTIAYDSMIESYFLFQHKKKRQGFSYLMKYFYYTHDFFLIFKIAKKKFFL